MRKVILAQVFLLAFVLRVTFLESFPPGFTPDEASFGYDAYSILKTGRDQWGHFFPVYLESFGDFKPPLYSYLTIPTVAIFGLTKFAVRLPNVLLGTAAVYIVYLLVLELQKFSKRSVVDSQRSSGKKTSLTISHQSLAIIASFFLTISPWHIQLSRGAFEANLTTFLMPLGIYLFIKGLKTNKFLIWSAVVFGLNLFSYHSVRLVAPLLVFILVFIFRKEFARVDRKITYYFFVIFTVFIFGVLYSFNQGAGRRVQDISIFRGALESQADARLSAIESGVSPFIARIFHNKYLVVADRFLDTYVKYFSIKFLFRKGAAEATYGMVPGIGVLHWFELPLLIGFLVHFLKNRNKNLWLIFLWILVAPIPASLTTGVGYAGNRAGVILPAIHIASVYGFVWYYRLFKGYLDVKSLKLFGTGIILIFLAFFLSFLGKYVNGANQLARGMLYGNLEVSYWLAENADKYNKVVVSRRLSEPHIFIAFANSWDPQNYQMHTRDWQKYKNEGLTFLDQLHKYSLGKYIFQNIDNEVLESSKATVLVGRPEELQNGLHIINRIRYPDGQDSILVAEPYTNVYANFDMVNMVQVFAETQ